jgi:hypothetical protein
LRHRLELSAHRALRELRQLRRDLGVDVSALPTCPFLEEIPEDEEDHEAEEEEDIEDEVVEENEKERVQNEPNSAETAAGDDAAESCEEGSRTVEPFAPTKLTPRAAERAFDVDKETRDRT